MEINEKFVKFSIKLVDVRRVLLGRHYDHVVNEHFCAYLVRPDRFVAINNSCAKPISRNPCANLNTSR